MNDSESDVIAVNDESVIFLSCISDKKDIDIKSSKTLGVRPNSNSLWSLKSLKELELELKKTQETLNTVNKDLLPDKGEKLIEKISTLKKYISQKLREDELMNGFQNLSIIDVSTPEKKETFQPKKDLKNIPLLIEINKKCNIPVNSDESNNITKIFEDIKKSEKSLSGEWKLTDKLRTTLMNHQFEALSWMRAREFCFPFGGILADDMGLGKTLTVLSHILSITPSSTDCKTTLIIAPTSLIHQWKYELLMHFHSSNIKYLIYYGPDRSKYNSRLTEVDIVITSYGTVCSKDSILHCKKWLRIVLDEAHYIKNYKCKSFYNLFQCDSKYKWTLTGTPIHNKLTDLYSLIKFLKFSPFDDNKYWILYLEKHIQKQMFLNLIVSTLILRRTKLDKNIDGTPLIKLPKKYEVIHKITLRNNEHEKYIEISDKFKNKIRNYLSPSSNKSFGQVLVMLLRLQQAASHFHLLKNKIELDEENIKDDLNDLVEGFSQLLIDSNSNSHLKDSDSIFNIKYRSSKLNKLLEILKDNKLKHKSNSFFKCVIVSQWTSFFEIIKVHLKIQGYSYDAINGNIPALKRQEIVCKFNKEAEPEILLLSLKAGGVGLNLVGANSLVIMDHHWNPALEQQACDRVYRVGQIRDVTIHKFIVANTIEEHINELKERKLKLASDTLNKKSHGYSSQLTKDDVKFMFNIKE